MAYSINENCVSCGACEPECPVDCISAAADKYAIDPNTCIDCGACAGVCPTDAIAAG
ncbi:MAG: 4Fe-4S binding protein [Oscillospiraceae bacterium]|nr:4Fe-4S binding protein [Oscillospiraceae bacterium]